MRIYNARFIHELSIQEMDELHKDFGDTLEVSAYENTIKGKYHVNF